jgi:NADH-quinone oxidoreductase subunit C
MATLEAIEQAVLDRFGGDVLEAVKHRGELTLRIRREAIHDVCLFCRDAPDLRFNYLSDLTAVDYLNAMNMRHVPRFEVAYHLLSLDYYHRLRLKAPVPEEDIHIVSVQDVWPAANWQEREVFDMFGILFDNHPDLTRILMPDDWEGHPLRKDFPLGGTVSFYFKRSSHPHAGEPPDYIPRIRVQDSDI